MDQQPVPVKVWDGWTRLFHWSIALLFVASVVTAKTGLMGWHMLSGYAALGVLVFRVIWGLVGSDTARFARFLRSPLLALRHVAHIGRREPDREIGHNPAGGWMALAMILLLLAQVVTGLFADDDVLTQGPLAQYASERTVRQMTGLHFRIVNLLYVAVALHLAAVLAYRVLKGQDLVGPMVTGVKRLPPEAAKAAPEMGSRRAAIGLAVIAAAFTWLIARLGPPIFF